MQPTGLPLVGQVAAGQPVLAEENIEEYVRCPRLAGGEEGEFVLRVAGESMKNAGILEGDLVVVRPQDTATDGEIVVALVGEEATVKRFFQEADHIRLQPENETMEPIRSADVGARQGRRPDAGACDERNARSTSASDRRACSTGVADAIERRPDTSIAGRPVLRQRDTAATPCQVGARAMTARRCGRTAGRRVPRSRRDLGGAHRPRAVALPGVRRAEPTPGRVGAR